MLPKSKRLNLKKDFKWVASGKRVESKYLKLFIRFGTNTQPRIGIATPGSIFKKATERNRAKRLVSAAFESAYYQPLDYFDFAQYRFARGRLPSAINIVALPKSSILGVKSQDVLSDLEEVLKKYAKEFAYKLN